MSKPELSVIIPIYNVTQKLVTLTQRCLRSVERNTSKPYQLIIIDNGSPLRLNFKADVYVRFPTNQGVASAWNVGLFYAKGTWIAFLNNDIEVPKDWDAQLLSHFEANTGIIKSEEGWSCCIIPSRIFQDIGKFDERYFAYFEDIDFEQRLKNAKIDIVQTDLKCIHEKHATAKEMPGMNKIYNESEAKFREKFKLSPLDKSVIVF